MALNEDELSVVLYLRNNGSAMYEHMREYFDYSDKKLKYILRRLKEKNILITKPYLLDTRKTVYMIQEDRSKIAEKELIIKGGKETLIKIIRAEDNLKIRTQPTAII